MSTWEPLPKRKKARTGGNSSSSSTSAAPTTTAQEEPLTQKESQDLSIANQIAANIAARSKINRGHTTLESKDGVGTENYECKLFLLFAQPFRSKSPLSSFFLSLLVDLDHTADVQCHAWGESLKEAFEKMGECMVNYMTDISLVEINEEENQTISVSGNTTPRMIPSSYFLQFLIPSQPILSFSSP